MDRRSIWMSLSLHGILLIFMFVDFSFTREYSKPPVAIMQIDLTKVQISHQTNLPQKSVAKKTPKKVVPPKEQKKVETKVSKQPVKKAVAVEPKVQPKPQPVPKNAVPVQSPQIKKEEKKLEEKKVEKNQSQSEDLQSLLATVDKIRQAPVKKEIQEDTIKAEGISGGTEGRLDQLMTISDKDFISSKLRECWNVDGGTDRLDEIVVEVKVGVNKDGSIRLVKYTNSMNIPAFRQVAESAVRAVRICENKGTDSPFRILAEKYADHYGDWKEISLRFSPTEGIF